MEEILPAARLLSQATAVTPSDYEHAKAVFLEHVQSAGAAAENLSKQVRHCFRQAPCHRCCTRHGGCAARASSARGPGSGAGFDLHDSRSRLPVVQAVGVLGRV